MSFKKEATDKLIDTRDKALLCARQVLDHKGADVVLLEVTGLSSFADFFIICGARSSRHAQGVADKVETALREQGLRPLGVEGRAEGHWILMDYGDVIIHIFYEPVREFYDLESLWSEAPRIAVES